MTKVKIRQLKHLEDAEYISEIDAAAIRGAHRFANVLLVVTGLFFVAFIAWASQAQIEQVTRGHGRVVPSSNIQYIQNLEGGILSDILAREGDVVDKGQALLKIDNRMAEADFRESQTRYYKLMAQKARLESEIRGDDFVTFPEDVIKNAREVMALERQLFAARNLQYESGINILKSQIDQKNQELRELEANIANLRSSYAIAKEELDLVKPLAEQGLTSRTEYLRMQREVSDLEARISSNVNAIPRLKSAIGEADQRLKESRTARELEAQQILNEVEAEFASVKELITAEQDRVTRTEVRSPVRGEVQEVMVKTIGGVIKPGQDLVAVVPIEDKLVIEAEVRPQDVAHIHNGQPAMVKITAYDFTIWGGLDAQVIHISPDTVENERGEFFYRVRLETNKNYIGSEKDPKYISSGMVAQVDILSEEKITILQYLLKPILRARANALREF